MHFDELLINYVGQMGKYQWRMTLLISIAAALPLSWYTMGVVFLAAVPDHWCAVPELNNYNLSTEEQKAFSIPIKEYNSKGQPVYLSCLVKDRNYSDLSQTFENKSTTKCQDGWIYSDDTYSRTVVTDFNLVCDKDLMLATSHSIFMAGFLTGVISIGTLSDIIGRKKTFIWATIILQASSVGLSFVQTYWLYCVLRFMQAFFGIGSYTSGYIAVMELAGPDRRAHAGMTSHWSWTIGHLIFTIPAFFIRDWRYLNLVTAGIGCLQFIVFFIIPESPRWLYNQDRSTEADIIVKRMANINKTQLPDPLVVAATIPQRKVTILDLFRHKRTRFVTLILLWQWCVVQMVYYGLSLSATSFGTNNFISVGLIALAEVPAHIYSHFAMHYFSRGRTLAFTSIAGGLFLFATIPVPKDQPWIILVLSLCGKVCVSAVGSMSYNLSTEVYPTSIRQAGLSAGSMSGRFGAILSPYVAYVSKHGVWIPAVIFGGCSICAGLLDFLLPETKGVPMPESMDEVDAFKKGGFNTENATATSRGTEHDLFNDCKITKI